MLNTQNREGAKLLNNGSEKGQADVRCNMKTAFSKKFIDCLLQRSSAEDPQLTRFAGKDG